MIDCFGISFVLVACALPQVNEFHVRVIGFVEAEKALIPALSEPATGQNKKPVGLWLFFGAVIITCILLILSLNGII